MLPSYLIPTMLPSYLVRLGKDLGRVLLFHGSPRVRRHALHEFAICSKFEANQQNRRTGGNITTLASHGARPHTYTALRGGQDYCEYMLRRNYGSAAILVDKNRAVDNYCAHERYTQDQDIGDIDAAPCQYTKASLTPGNEHEPLPVRERRGVLIPLPDHDAPNEHHATCCGRPLGVPPPSRSPFVFRELSALASASTSRGEVARRF